MSAIIPIDDKYRIELDRDSWQVARWNNHPSHKDGGSWETVDGFKSLQQAGESLQRRLVAEDELEGVQEVIEALHGSARLIAMAIAGSQYPDSWSDATAYFGV